MRACTVATMENIPEVVAVVGDHIHRAVRVQKRIDYRFEGMHSPTFEPIGIIADKIEIKESVVKKPRKLPRDIELRNEFSHNVFKVRLDCILGWTHNSLPPFLKSPKLKLEGIIIETLAASGGNVPVEDKWKVSFLSSRKLKRSAQIFRSFWRRNSRSNRK